MRKIERREQLTGGSALCVLGLLVLLIAVSPAHTVLWLVFSVAALLAIIAILLRQLTLQSNDLLRSSSELDDKSEAVQDMAMELTELVLVDPLTGSRNRRGFIDLVEHQMKVATREWKKLHFVIVNVDEMSSINDLHGHAAGDSALIEVVRIIWRSSRTVDVVGRMGGDEFAVALIHADDPSVVAARIEAEVAGRVRDSDHPYELHVSVGVATFDPAVPLSLDEILKIATASMYEKRRAAGEARAKRLSSPALR
jgi:diguanylate cyclase (GGDEF)-like protein